VTTDGFAWPERQRRQRGMVQYAQVVDVGPDFSFSP
jgi:hypothetical protein